jgi:hypothetical protein
MFLTPELAAVFVETTLEDASRTYRKPYMIRLVLLVNTLAVLGVRLCEPPVVIVPLNLLDMRSPLTLEILAHKLFEGAVILEDILLTRLLVRTDRKELHGFHVGFLGEQRAVQVSPRNVWVSRGFLVRPKHSKARPAVDGSIDNTVPVECKVLRQIHNDF